MNTNGLMLHCGGKSITEDELGAITPDSVAKANNIEYPETYVPVDHLHLINEIKWCIKATNPNWFEFRSASYGIRKNGAEMFAVLTWKATRDYFGDGDIDNYGFQIGIVNSMNFRIPIRFVGGISVFVCDNMALNGEIMYARKHTKNVWETIYEKVRLISENAMNIYDDGVKDINHLQEIEITDNRGYEILGRLHGLKVISPRMLTAAIKDWRKPRHEDFASRNLWSLYNCANEAMKKHNPNNIVEAHTALHDEMKYCANVASLANGRSPFFKVVASA